MVDILMRGLFTGRFHQETKSFVYVYWKEVEILWFREIMLQSPPVANWIAAIFSSRVGTHIKPQ